MYELTFHIVERSVVACMVNIVPAP